MNVFPEMLPAAFKMMAALGVVLAGLLLSFYAARKFIGLRAGHPHNRLVRVLASSFLGGKKSVTLVEVPGAVLVLGVTSDSIRLLSKIDDSETLHLVKESEKKPASLAFRDHLQKFSSRLTGLQNDAQ